MQSQANRIKSAWRILPGRVRPYLGSRRRSRLVIPTTKDFTTLGLSPLPLFTVARYDDKASHAYPVVSASHN